MPRINPLIAEQIDDGAKNLLEEIQLDFGIMPNVARTMARSPAIFEAYINYNEALSKTSISDELREKIALTVSATNRCAYCASAHAAISRELGIDEEEIEANLRAESSDDHDAGALQFTQALIEKRGFVSDEDLAAVREAGFGDREIIEMIGTAAITIFTNYFNHVAATEVDFPLVDVGSPVW